ncbi:MAG: hypothetical protein ABFE08_08985 [Armatimonadia bacterium]
MPLELSTDPLEYPEAQPEGPEPLDNERVQAIVQGYYDAAADFVESEIGPDRAKMGRYYRGEPFGNEEEGRSQVVSRDVRDTVIAIMPSLMRVFFGPEKVVEFSPRSAEDIPLAEQATDLVNYVVREDNPGFLEFYSWFKDALNGKVGVVKVYWDERRETTQETVTGLNEESVAILMAETEGQPDVRLDLRQAPDGSIDGTIVRTRSNGKARFAAIPPEEFLIHPDAKDVDSARYCAHRTYLTVSDLVAMGYSHEQVLDAAEASRDPNEFGEEATARNRWVGVADNGDGEDPSSSPVLYIEHFVLIDADGDGVAELHKICTIGSALGVVADEVTDIRPFAYLCPDPEPHEMFGTSVAEVVADIQLIKSAVLREVLNSLTLAVTPRSAVVEGKVNMADVLSNELGGVVRMEAPGMVQPLVTPFVGKDAFPVIQYLDEVKQDRTGISKAAAGLDPDALQSSTKAAVAATITAANQHIELIARIFAEVGVKPLYRKIIHLMAQHQETPRMLKLRNTWVEVSPSAWAIDRDIKVLIGVGEGTTETRISTLMGLAGKMEAIFTNLGVTNPLVHLSNYREVLKRILELSGFEEVDKYLQPIDPATEGQEQPPPDEQAAEKEAAAMLAQVQVEQIKADIAMKQAELELRREDMMLKHQREVQKAQEDAALRREEMRMRYQQGVDVAQIQRQMAAEGKNSDASE